ncbi:fasciclin domain-containing protein [Pontibacter sp. H249]|uniref:fasciclin domain-containing protein n=1 Tax=Pontibacter sp. H249 TaxID=3133420 RepID=UPI0030BC917D
MRRINMYVLTGALLCSLLLLGCGGADDSRNENPMQEERSRPNLGSQPEARGTEQNTDGRQAGEGQMGGERVDPTATGSELGGREMMPTQNIVENISSSPNLVTFASVVRKAELVRTLNGTGPYTVFAPDNDSFEALQKDVLDGLMKDENRKELVNLINNHIIAGKLTADNLQDGAMLKTIGGQQLKVSKRGQDIMVEGAKVTMPNNMSENGVVHVINKVLQPVQAQ